MLGNTSNNYEGQFFITSVKYEGGKRQETREWIPRTVYNDTHMAMLYVLAMAKVEKILILTY